uniref:Uncharacterized protein n=1 Tax=Meloidogyne enterolobii TaxID=390850 RepID=A0A6V7UAA1_MELEN|nr:unnamed protein product [Meloidogyne enterolobii]
MSVCLTHVVIAGLTKKYTTEDFRQLINDKAKDPEIYTYQQLVEELHYNTGDAFAFVKLKSEEAANCLIARLNESKLEGCDHVHASFIPKFGIACSPVPNALVGNSVDEPAEDPDPCGGPLDGSVERRVNGWEEVDHYHDFTSDRDSWYGDQEFGITADYIQ